MPITEILAKNAQLYSHDVCLVELNPEAQENNEKTWKEFDLVESNLYSEWIRREMTWRQFDRSANQFANLLLARQLGKGKKSHSF